MWMMNQCEGKILFPEMIKLLNYNIIYIDVFRTLSNAVMGCEGSEEGGGVRCIYLMSANVSNIVCVVYLLAVSVWCLLVVAMVTEVLRAHSVAQQVFY